MGYFKVDNYKTDNTARRYVASVSLLGTTQIHLRSPSIIAWWSAAFPGFGHLLLSKCLRGYILFIWEVSLLFLSHSIEAVTLFIFRRSQQDNSRFKRGMVAYVTVHICVFCL